MTSYKKETIKIHEKKLFGILAAAALFSSAFAVQSMAAQFTLEEAKAKALTEAQVAEDDVAYITAERDLENGQSVYEVEFLTKDYREYDYVLRESDGAVLSVDYDAENHFYDTLPSADRKVTVTTDKAKEIALAHAGKKADEVRIFTAKLEYDDGMAHYDISFYDKDRTEYEFEISAYTGEIISFGIDGQAADGKLRDTSAASGTKADASVTLEEAKAMALKKAGRSASEVRGFEIEADMDDGRRIYEGSFSYGSTEYEFEIDANSGAFLKWETERD